MEPNMCSAVWSFDKPVIQITIIFTDKTVYSTKELVSKAPWFNQFGVTVFTLNCTFRMFDDIMQHLHDNSTESLTIEHVKFMKELLIKELPQVTHQLTEENYKFMSSIGQGAWSIEQGYDDMFDIGSLNFLKLEDIRQAREDGLKLKNVDYTTAMLYLDTLNHKILEEYPLMVKANACMICKAITGMGFGNYLEIARLVKWIGDTA